MKSPFNNIVMKTVDKVTIKDVQEALIWHTPDTHKTECVVYRLPNGAIWVLNNNSFMIAKVRQDLFLLSLNNNKGENPYSMFKDGHILECPEDYDTIGNSIYAHDGFRAFNGSFLYLVEYVKKFIAPKFEPKKRLDESV